MALTVATVFRLTATFLICLTCDVLAQTPSHDDSRNPLSSEVTTSHSTSAEVEAGLRAKLDADPNSIAVMTELAALLSRNRLHDAALHYWQCAASLSPSNADIKLSIALELLEIGRNDEAVTDLRELTAYQPQSEIAFINLGAALARIGKYEEAIVAYKKALVIVPQSADVFLSLAKINMLLLRDSDALTYIKQYETMAPKDFQGRYICGLLYHRLNQESDAITEFQRAVQLDSSDYAVQWNLGAALIEAGQIEAAIDHLRRATQIKPKATEAHFQLARAYRAKGDRAASNAEQQTTREILKTQLDVSRAAMLSAEGSRALTSGDSTTAIEKYHAAIEADPQDAKTYYDLALSYERSGDQESERKALIAAERIDPDVGVVQNQLGYLDMLSGQRDAAETHFARALRSEPGNVAALGNLGVLYAQSGRLEESEHQLRLAVESSAAYPNAQRNLALVLAARGRYSEALEFLSHSLQLFPGDAELWLTQGRIQQQSEQAARANESFRQAVHFAPTSTAAQLELSSSCMSISDLSCAIQAATEAVHLAPDSAETHAQRSEVLCFLHRTDEANTEKRTALKLDPVSPKANSLQCNARANP